MPENNGDATASFSGFLYQADIALLKALEKIVEIGNNYEELKKWSLEVEGEEDFTLIKTDDSGKKVFREAYQVKETKLDKPSDYTIPVIKLFEEFKKGGDRKEFLVTEKKVDYTKNIDFFNGLYSGNGLTKYQKNLKDLIEKSFLRDKINFDEKRTRKNKKGKTVSEKYKFNDEETKETIQEFVSEEVKNFIKDENFGYIYCGNFKEVQKNIIELLKEIKDGIKQPDNYLKFLESKIKRKIQENKGKEYKNRDRISFLEIKSWIVDFDRLAFTNADYQDMYLNIFIKTFNKMFGKIYSGNFFSGNVKDIFNEIDNNKIYDEFLEKISQYISNYFFYDKQKSFGLIKYTVGNKDVENIEDISNFNGLNEFIEKVTGFDDKIRKKIQMIVSYIYAKETNKELKEKFCGDSFLSVFYKNKRGILTGLINDPEYLAEFLQSNIFYRYEKTHIGIYGVDKYLYEYLGEDKEESKFRKENEDIEKLHKEYQFNITKTKKIKIFSGKNCLKKEGDRNAKYFMN